MMGRNRGRVQSAIQWTGDNIDEIVSFNPWVLEWPYYDKDWPYMKVIGILDRDGNRVKMKMRLFIIKLKDGTYVIE